MTQIGPALRRFLSDLKLIGTRDGALALFMTTVYPYESGQPALDPWPEVVADVEREGNARIGAVSCPMPHGVEDEYDGVAAPTRALWAAEPCPACGAAL